MILAGPRVNTLIHLKGTNMYITDTEVTFTFLKLSRPSYKQKLRAFTSSNLCPAATLIIYLEHRLPASDDPALFIATVNEEASKDSISRWIKLTMAEESNSGLFTSYSCRSVSTSKAFETNVNLQMILNSANWSGDSTFKNTTLERYSISIN